MSTGLVCLTLIAARSFRDVEFSFLIFLPQVVLGAKGIAKGKMATQFATPGRADVGMMLYPLPWGGRERCRIIQRLEYLALSDSPIAVVDVA